MPVFTSLWNLLKKNPATDGADTFNIQTMLNDNWDKIDAALGLKAVNADVRAATTANITLSGLQTIDGVTLAAGDRVLVKNQTTGSQNGIYTAAEGPWTRATDADVSGKLASGLLVYVKEGSSNGKKQWRLSNTGPITLGTTALTFELVAGAGSATDAVIGNRTITDTTAPAGDSGTLTSLFGWLGYMIKAITGKSSWRTAPATTLEAAKAHMDAATGVHGATSAATAGAIMQRDASGRAKVAAPSAADDIARKAEVDAAIATAAADAMNKADAVQANLTAHIGSGGTAHAVATASAAGFMSAADKSKLDGIAAGANNYTHPTGDGNLHVPATGTTNNGKVLKAGSTAGSIAWGNVAFSELTGKPTTLSGYGITDAAPSSHVGAGGTAHAVATTSAAGFMSAADKAKLDGITDGATAGTATPLMDGTAAVGTSTAYAREDHRHPTDTTRAPLASPAFTGTPTAPTAAAGTNNTQIATTAFVQNAINDVKSTSLGYGTTAGTGTAYTLTLNPAPTALVSGMRVTIKVHTANTGAATLNVNGLGAKSIKKANGNDVAAGNLKASGVYTLVYDGTNFILQGEGGEYGTATAADVLTGKTIGTENGLVTGTMPDKTNATEVIDTLNYSTGNKGSNAVSVSDGPSGDDAIDVVVIPPKGYYDGSTSKVNVHFWGVKSNLVKAGQKIGWVNGAPLTGTFTSDANAAAGDILSSKTAYVNGNKVTGNMPSKVNVVDMISTLDDGTGNKGSGTVSVTDGNPGDQAINIQITPPKGYYDGSTSKINVRLWGVKSNVIKYGEKVGWFNSPPVTGTYVGGDVESAVFYNNTTIAGSGPGAAKTSPSNNNVVGRVRFSPNGRMLAVSYDGYNYSGGIIEIYKRTGTSWTLTTTLNSGTPHFVDWVHDNLVVYSAGGSIWLANIGDDGSFAGTSAGIYVTSDELTDLCCSPDGTWIVASYATQPYLRAFRYNGNDFSWTYQFSYSPSYYTLGMAFTPDSQNLFWPCYTRTTGNLYHFKINSPTNMYYYSYYSTYDTASALFIKFCNRNNGKFLIATETGIRAGYFDGNAGFNWYGWYGLSWNAGYLEEWELGYGGNGDYGSYAHRGSSGDRNVIIRRDGSGNLTKVSAPGADGYGTSTHHDVNGRWIAFGTKSGGAFTYRLEGSAWDELTLGDDYARNFFKVYRRPGAWPPQIEVAGNFYQMIRS